MGLSQESKAQVRNFINTIHYINKLKKKNLKMHLKRGGRICSEIQWPFRIKNSLESKNNGNFP